MLRVLLLALGLSAALAACPNDCSGHGACNQYSACECYRNYMGADCSERMCAYGKAFVDTPQGDLNADGVVERPDTVTFVLAKIGSFFATSTGLFSTDADNADGTSQVTITGTTESVVNIATDESQGLALVGQFITIGSETREIVAFATNAVTVYPPFTSLADAAEAYTIHSYANKDKVVSSFGGCTWDGSAWDCGKASYFTLKNFPKGGEEHRYKIIGNVDAATELSSNGVSPLSGAGVTGVADDGTIAACNAKYGRADLTHAIRVHVVVEPDDDTVNTAISVPNWQAAGAKSCSGHLDGADPPAPCTMHANTAQCLVATGNCVYTGKGHGPNGLVEQFYGLGDHDAVDENRASDVVDATQPDSVSLIVSTTLTTGYTGGRIRICYAASGLCVWRTIVLNDTANDFNVEPALPSIPQSGDLLMVEAPLTTVADDATNGAGTSGTSVVVCSPGVDSSYSVSSPSIYTVAQPDGSTYKTQWTPDTTWEAYPAEHAAAAAGTTQNAHVNPAAAVNAGGRASNGEPAGVTRKAHWDEGHFYRECSGKGSCDRSSGRCDCFPGYAGTGCVRLACPNDCSGHGQCRRILDIDDKYVAWDFDKTAVCRCESGYSGLDCSQRACPMGDDPITRGGTTEIQKFGVASANLISLATQYGTEDHAMFALEFTDEMGDKWVTHAIDFTDGAHAHWFDTQAGTMRQPFKLNAYSVSGTSHSTSAFNMHASETALPSLTGMYVTTLAASSASWVTGRITANTAGDAALTVALGTTPADSAPYYITRADPRADHSLAQRVEAALEALPNNVLENVEVSLDTSAGLYASVTFSENTGDIPDLGVRYCWNFGAYSGTESEVECSQADGSWADTSSKALNPFGVATTDNARFVHSTTTAGAGNKENAECSNRGLCDYSTGLCKCFAGYTDFDCSIQNSLASS